MFKVNNKINVTKVVLVPLLLTLNIFHTFLSVFTVNFEQKNIYCLTSPNSLREKPIAVNAILVSIKIVCF